MTQERIEKIHEALRLTKINGSKLTGFDKAIYDEISVPLFDCIEELLAEIARLRKAIEEAPHERVCPVSMYWEHNLEGDVNCTCWKRDALESK